MNDLPLAARLFVGAVLAAGAVVVAIFVPHSFANPLLFATLLGLLVARVGAEGPAAARGQRIDDVGVVCGGFRRAAAARRRRDDDRRRDERVGQCTIRTTTKTATFRTLFSMASLVLTVKAAGWVYTLLGGTTGSSSLSLLTRLPKPLVGAATTYFVGNTR